MHKVKKQRFGELFVKNMLIINFYMIRVKTYKVKKWFNKFPERLPALPASRATTVQHRSHYLAPASWPQAHLAVPASQATTVQQFRVRPILVSGIRYRLILANIGQYRYRPILIWVSVPIPVVLSIISLSQQSTIVSILYRIFMHMSRIHITCTHLYSAQNRIFSTKKFVQPSIGIGIGIGTAVADSIGYRAPVRYRSNPMQHRSHYLAPASWPQAHLAVQGHAPVGQENLLCWYSRYTQWTIKNVTFYFWL